MQMLREREEYLDQLRVETHAVQEHIREQTEQNQAILDGLD